MLSTRRILRLLSTLAFTATLLVLALPVSAQTSNGYAEWELSGGAGAYTGTMTLPPGFPEATFTSDSRAPAAVPTGVSSWLPVGSPPGAVYGSSQDVPYLNLRPAADNAASPSTTTYTFSRPTPASGWAFVLSDIDADTIRVTATDADGAPVSASDLGLESAFNYCDASPRPSSCSGLSAPYDIPVATSDTDSVTVTGNGADTEGASAWFRPSVPLSTLTFTFTWQSGAPVYSTHFAVERRTVTGTVTLDGADGVEDVQLTLVGPDGTVLGTTTTDENGSYGFAGLSPVDGYTVVVTPPDGTVVSGPDEQPVDLNAGDVEDVDFDLATVLYSISGTVTEVLDDETEPVDGAEVVLRDSGGDIVATVPTNADGTYTFPELPVGSYLVELVTPDGYLPLTASEVAVDIDDADVGDVDFEITLLLYDIPGQVVDEEEVPIPDVGIELVDADGETVIDTSSDEEGLFLLEGLLEGSYELLVTPSGEYEAFALELEVPIDGDFIVIVLTEEQTTTPTSSTTTTSTTSTTLGAGGTLPKTGTETTDLTMAGILTLLAGAGLLLLARREA